MRTQVGTLPNTFIVGAPKSGTTYLAHWLGLSDQVYAPKVKEPGFFWEERQYRRGLAHYASTYYREAGSEPVVLDATPWYLYPESVPERIAGAVGEEWTRIIIVLREPVARAISMYHDQLGRLRETRTLAEMVADELSVEDPVSEVAREGGPDLFQHYVLCGRYAEPVARYIDTFGLDSTCVLLAEELWGQPDRVRQQLERFLGVGLPEAPARASNPASRARLGAVEHLLSRIEESASPLRSLVARLPAAKGHLRAGMDALARWNQSAAPYPEPDPAILRLLRDWFQPSNQRLEQMLERSLAPWR